MKRVRIKVIGAKDFYIIPEHFFDLKDVVGRKLKSIRARIIGSKDFYIKSEVFIPEGIPTWQIEIPLWTDAHPNNYDYYSFGENPTYSYFKRKILYSPKIAVVFSSSDQEELVRNFRSGIPPSPTRSWHCHPQLILRDMTRQVDELPLNKYQAKIRIYYPSGHKWEGVFRGGIGSEVRVNETDLPLAAFTYNYGTFPKTLVIKVYPWGDFQVWNINEENDTEVWIMSIKIDPELQISDDWIHNPIVWSAAWWATNILLEETNQVGGNPFSFFHNFGDRWLNAAKVMTSFSDPSTVRVFRNISPGDPGNGFVRILNVPIKAKVHSFIKNFLLPIKINSSSYFDMGYFPYTNYPVWWESQEDDTLFPPLETFLNNYFADIGGTIWEVKKIFKRTSGNRINLHTRAIRLKYETCVSPPLPFSSPPNFNKNYYLYTYYNWQQSGKHLAYVLSSFDREVKGIIFNENDPSDNYLVNINLPPFRGFVGIHGEMIHDFWVDENSIQQTTIYKFLSGDIRYFNWNGSWVHGGIDFTGNYAFIFDFTATPPRVWVFNTNNQTGYLYELDNLIVPLPPSYYPKYGIPLGIVFVDDNKYYCFRWNYSTEELEILGYIFPNNRVGILGADGVIWGGGFDWAITGGGDQKFDVIYAGGIRKIGMQASQLILSSFDGSPHRAVIKFGPKKIAMGAFDNWGIRILPVIDFTLPTSTGAPNYYNASFTYTTKFSAPWFSISSFPFSVQYLSQFSWYPNSVPDL